MVVSLLFLASCGGGKNSSQSDVLHEDNGLQYAVRLSLQNHPEGWYEARVINPWDTTRLLQTVAMVPYGLDHIPENIPDNAEIVRIPLKNSLVQSTVHVGLIEELGGIDAIKGISDLPYIKSELIKKKISEGTMVDCGPWMSPDLEKILKMQPDGILVSPYEDGGNYGHITELGFPIIFVADYTEMDPLGRAEWLKYYGLLYGKENAADSIFNIVEEKYNTLKKACLESAEKTGKKKVLLDIPQGGIWYVSTRESVNDRFIRDAGGINPFSYITRKQFSALDPERVLNEANDADIWIIRLNSIYPLSRDFLVQKLPVATSFKAFNENNVWGCNTNESTYFEDTPFHPEKLLEDLHEILYSSNAPDSLNYFSRLH